jgi:hypothetical protein
MALRVYYMISDDGVINISTKKEPGHKVVQSYKLRDIDNITVWDIINKLIVELNKHDDENLRLYIFTKTFKDYIIPVTTCSTM